MSDMKFVTFYGNKGEQIIVFPKIMQHLAFADKVRELSFESMRPISGGFVEDGECVGKSISLRMESRGEADTKLLKQLQG